MGWRRVLAVAIVLASGGTALALQVWPVSAPAAESNPAIPVNQNGRIVFSLRNTTSTPTTVDSFFVGQGSDCTQIASPVPLDPFTPVPWTIGANEQMQFTAETGGFSTTGNKSCSWTVFTTPSGSTSVSATFHVVSTEDVDVQPTSMSFGTLPPFSTEQQTLVITGWQTGSANVLATLTSDTLGRFELIGCGSNDSCQITMPGGGGFGSALVQCNATGTGNGNGQITVTSTDLMVDYGTVGLHCDVGSGSGSGIVLDPMILSQSAQIGFTDIDPIQVMGTGSLISVAITSNLGTLTIQECGGQPSCSLSTPLSTSLNIVCTPTSTTDTGTLAVTGTAGSASAALQCGPATGSPVLSVTKNSISFDDTNVFGESSDTFEIENLGGGSLTNVTLSLGTGGDDFAFSECDETLPCTVMAGIPKQITVYFRPQSHDFKMSQLTVTADGDGSGSGSGLGTGTTTIGEQTETVTLSGTAYGGIMVVTSPMASQSYVLDLGSVPLNQEGSGQIKVRNDGNATITAMITGDTAPYTLLSDSDVIAGGVETTFEVRCSSSTPSPSNDQTWTISGMGAYAGAPQDITVRCAIADTNVIVDPLAFDFGEVRTGTPAQSLPLTVTNPGPGAATITGMKLRTPRTGLSLTPADTMTTLTAGAVASASLKLETAEDSDLTGEFVDIAVGSAMLNLPVRGKVVTAHSRIAPQKLDLGTACVGSVPTGTVRLVNGGTATLAVDAPEMDAGGSFVVATPGTLFPAALVPSMNIAAEITPASTTGRLTGTLTWRDDVPSTYEVPVTLEYVASGTALSPRGLDFGGVEVGDLTISQGVMLENCDDAPAMIVVKSVRGIKGPIGAWIVEPSVGFTKMLASHERQAILVTFQPPGRGHYEAELVVETASGPEKILLVGDATGRDFGNTSFYTCACSAPGAPWGGWPIAFVVVVISARRRRGSSSAR